MLVRRISVAKQRAVGDLGHLVRGIQPGNQRLRGSTVEDRRGPQDRGISASAYISIQPLGTHRLDRCHPKRCRRSANIRFCRVWCVSASWLLPSEYRSYAGTRLGA
jgi:hypothetical protein